MLQWKENFIKTRKIGKRATLEKRYKKISLNKLKFHEQNKTRLQVVLPRTLGGEDKGKVT
jgi:hypothetical protein